MALVKVFHHFRGDKAEFSLDSTTKTSTYTVQFDNKTWTEFDAAAANDGTTAIPQLGAALSGTSLKVVRVSPAKQDNGYFCDITVEYGPTNSDSPSTTAPWDIEYAASYEPWKKQVEKDLDGLQFVNSAKEKYDDKFEIEMFDEIISLKFKSSSIDWTNINSCIGKLNTDSLSVSRSGYTRTFGAKTLRLEQAQYDINFGNYGSRVWQMGYKFRYRPDWKMYIVDKGRHHLTHITTAGYEDEEFGEEKVVKNTDSNGETTDTPQYLDGHGKLLAAGAAVVYFPDTGFRMVDNASFSGLFSGLN